jgi:hypothetical protein
MKFSDGRLRAGLFASLDIMKEFNKLLGDRFTLQIPEAGLNFVAWLRGETDFAKVARVYTNIGTKPSPLSFYCIDAKPQTTRLFSVLLPGHPRKFEKAS